MVCCTFDPSTGGELPSCCQYAAGDWLGMTAPPIICNCGPGSMFHPADGVGFGGSLCFTGGAPGFGEPTPPDPGDRLSCRDRCEKKYPNATQFEQRSCCKQKCQYGSFFLAVDPGFFWQAGQHTDHLSGGNGNEWMCPKELPAVCICSGGGPWILADTLADGEDCSGACCSAGQGPSIHDLSQSCGGPPDDGGGGGGPTPPGGSPPVDFPPATCTFNDPAAGTSAGCASCNFWETYPWFLTGYNTSFLDPNGPWAAGACCNSNPLGYFRLPTVFADCLHSIPHKKECAGTPPDMPPAAVGSACGCAQCDLTRRISAQEADIDGSGTVTHVDLLWFLRVLEEADPGRVDAQCLPPCGWPLSGAVLPAAYARLDLDQSGLVDECDWMLLVGAVMSLSYDRTSASGACIATPPGGAPPVASTRGDLNGDGAIDLIDAAALQARWQATTTSTDCAELSGDRRVGPDDLLGLLQRLDDLAGAAVVMLECTTAFSTNRGRTVSAVVLAEQDDHVIVTQSCQRHSPPPPPTGALAPPPPPPTTGGFGGPFWRRLEGQAAGQPWDEAGAHGAAYEHSRRELVAAACTEERGCNCPHLSRAYMSGSDLLGLLIAWGAADNGADVNFDGAINECDLRLLLSVAQRWCALQPNNEIVGWANAPGRGSADADIYMRSGGTLESTITPDGALAVHRGGSDGIVSWRSRSTSRVGRRLQQNSADELADASNASAANDTSAPLIDPLIAVICETDNCSVEFDFAQVVIPGSNATCIMEWDDLEGDEQAQEARVTLFERSPRSWTRLNRTSWTRLDRNVAVLRGFTFASRTANGPAAGKGDGDGDAATGAGVGSGGLAAGSTGGGGTPAGIGVNGRRLGHPGGLVVSAGSASHLSVDGSNARATRRGVLASRRPGFHIVQERTVAREKRGQRLGVTLACGENSTDDDDSAGRRLTASTGAAIIIIDDFPPSAPPSPPNPPPESVEGAVLELTGIHPRIRFGEFSGADDGAGGTAAAGCELSLTASGQLASTCEIIHDGGSSTGRRQMAATAPLGRASTVSQEEVHDLRASVRALRLEVEEAMARRALKAKKEEAAPMPA